jgi:putative transposase
MIKALKVRLYPNEEQKILLEKHFGACRFVWNHFLEVRNKYYAEHKNEKKSPSVFDTMKMLTALKKDLTWHSDRFSGTIQIIQRSDQRKTTSILSYRQVLR